MHETIDVLCCITPSGQFVFAHDSEAAQRVGRNWRASLTDEQRAAHEAAGTYGAFVQIRMLKSEFNAIPCTTESYALSRE